MKLKKYSWLAVLPMIFTACQEDALVKEQQQDKIYTISATMDGGATSRAQIVIGNEADASAGEIFMWNEGDSFDMYQNVDDAWEKSTFTISNYSETGEGEKTTAMFKANKPATAGAGFMAFYPANELNSGVDHYLPTAIDFTTETDAWKNYFKSAMLMKATSESLDAENPIVEFQHLCSLARITYTNKTGTDQSISYFCLNGHEPNAFGTSYNYNVGNGDSGGDTADRCGLEVNGLTVPYNESVDLYLLFFPKEFVTDGKLQVIIKHPSIGEEVNQKSTPDMNVSTIAEFNDNATGFEAGKRYWFKVTETEDGLKWTKFLNEEPEEPEVPRVSTLDALQTAIASGATNIILTKTITLTDDTSLNLNGKTLTLSEDFEWVGNAAIVSNGYALTINGPIEGCQKTCIDKYLIEVKNASNVDLNEGELITFGVANAVKVVDTNFSVETSLIEAEDGFAVDVIAETKPVHVYLGTEYGAGIVGKVRFYNNYNQSGSRLEVRGESDIQGNLVKLGDNQEGLYIFVHPEVEVDHTSGWPIFVATVEDLQAELEENQQAVINLAAPITITSNLNLNGNTLVVDEEVWMSQKPQPEAAITVAGTGNAPIVISNGQIRGTSSKFGGFLIKATCKFNLDQVSLTAGQLLNGVYIVNSFVNIIESKITANQSSLHIFADTNNSVVQIENSEINSGSVIFINNYSLATETKPEVEPSALVVVEGSVVDSNIIIDGEYTKYLDIAVLDSGSLIKGDVVIEGGNGPFELIVDEGGKVEGKNWPSQGQGGGENPDNIVSTWKQLALAAQNSSIKEIILAAPVVADAGVDLQGKTLSLSKDFEFGESNAAIMFTGNYGLSNGTFKASSSDATKYMISSKDGLHLSHNFKLIAGDNLNGVYVEDNSCAIYDCSSITVVNGHAFKAVSNNAKVFLQMDNDATITGNVFLEANNTAIDNNNIHLMEGKLGYGRINGNVTISGNNASTVCIIMAMEGLVTGKISGGKVEIEGGGEEPGGNQGGDKPQGGNTNGSNFSFEEF